MRRAVAILILAVTLGAISPGQAYSLSCTDLSDLIMGDDQVQHGLAAGYIFGDIDFLAGLLCFVGNQQCDCVQNVATARTNDLGSAIGSELARCVQVDGSQPAFGSVSRGVRALCPY